MNKLNFSISLRERGLAKNEMIREMKQNGFELSEIDYYLKKSDEIHLNHLLKNKKASGNTKSSRTFKSLILLMTLLLLAAVFFGYVSIGLLGLFILWGLVKFGSFRK